MKILIAFLLIIIASAACKSPESALPDGNLNKEAAFSEVNTSDDNVAPVQRPQKYDPYCPAIKKEFESRETVSLIKPASDFIENMFPVNDYNREAVDYLTRSVESMHFTGENSGFAAFSYRPSDEFSRSRLLPDFEKSANNGGTDIFLFEKDSSGKYIFKEPGNGINSLFWDSHPFSITDTLGEECKTLLIWSSDRDSPYSKRVTIDGDTIISSNTDLFYVFYSGNKFGKVKKLQEPVNSKGNEGTPFIYCGCCNPKLLFSSDRDKNRGLDIFYSEIFIDYENEVVIVQSGPVAFAEPINSRANDRFPMVALPLNESGNGKKIYLTSDRFDKNREMGFRSRDTIYENAGGYDLYAFDLPAGFGCPKPEPPEIFLELAVIDILNPENPVKDNSMEVRDGSGKLIENFTKTRSGIKVKLKEGQIYSAYGGSNYNQIDCDAGRDSVLHFYTAPMTARDEEGESTEILVDTLAGGTVSPGEYEKLAKVRIDTSITTLEFKNDSVEAMLVTTQRIVEPVFVGNNISYSVEETQLTQWGEYRFYSIPVPDTENPGPLNGAVLESELTKNDLLDTRYIRKDTVISDTVFVFPEYFVKPPCECDFTNFLTSFEQNVPYFQTGFWEANTLSNFRRDLQRLQTSKFAEARWIELHRDNQHFGEERSGRQARIYEYENFAKTVDKNLQRMAGIIGGGILENYEEIKQIAPETKLIISVEAWSDRRPVRRGWYIGDEVDYMEGELTGGLQIDFNPVSITNKSSLSENNDTLSRLRAYYGYRELLNELKESDLFLKYLERGRVLLPDSISEDYSDKDIIILTKGNFYDPTQYKVPRYAKDTDSSLYMLDTVRRIDVYVNTLQYSSGRFVKSDCCNENLPCFGDKKDAATMERRKKFE